MFVTKLFILNYFVLPYPAESIEFIRIKIIPHIIRTSDYYIIVSSEEYNQILSTQNSDIK